MSLTPERCVAVPISEYVEMRRRLAAYEIEVSRLRDMVGPARLARGPMARTPTRDSEQQLITEDDPLTRAILFAGAVEQEGAAE